MVPRSPQFQRHDNLIKVIVKFTDVDQAVNAITNKPDAAYGSALLVEENRQGRQIVQGANDEGRCS